MIGHSQGKDYDGQVASRIGKTPPSRFWTIVMYVIIAITAILALVSIIIPGVIMIIEDQNNIQEPSVLPSSEKAEYQRLLLKHGFAGKVSVIEIGTDGSLYFERDGERCRLD